MKIVRIKTKSSKKDGFANLCLLQLIIVIIIVVGLFFVSKISISDYNSILAYIKTMFEEDFDLGGYFTPSQEKSFNKANENLELAVFSEYSDSEKIVYTCVVTEKNTEKNNSAEIFGNYSSSVIMPVMGSITSNYGEREHPVFLEESFHKGIDIAADFGTMIYACMDGVVTETGTAQMAGNYIKLLHGESVETLYCHCSEVYVKKGLRVRKGDVIASVGQTGLATGPHLHFELHKNSVAVNPNIILDKAENVY